MNPSSKAVLAVIVTFHPLRGHLSALIETILPQVQQIVIVDNGSDDSTVNWIRELISPYAIELLTLERNIGISAAQNLGITRIKELGADYVILFDHDSKPAPNMVEILLAAAQKKEALGVAVAAMGPRYFDQRQNNPSPFIEVKGFSVVRYICSDTQAILPVSYVIASGSLIPIPTLDAVGGMLENLFVDYVDIEWGLRAAQKGFSSFGVCGALMEHDLGDEPLVFMGKSFPYHSPLRHYYLFRNAVYLYLYSDFAWRWKMGDAWRLLLKYGFYSLYGKPRLTHLRMMTKGIWHGLIGRMGMMDSKDQPKKHTPDLVHTQPNTSVPKKRIRENTIWSLVGGGSPLIAAALFIPYCFKNLGSEAFGVLTLIWSLIGYFSFFDLGIGRALTYQMGRLHHSESNKQIPAVLRSGLVLTLLTGLVGAFIMYSIAPYLAHDWLKITPNIADDAQLSFQIAALGVIFATNASGIRGAQEGLDQFKASNLNKVVLGFLTFSLPALSIYLNGPQLYPIVIYLVTTRLLMLLLNAYQLRKYLFASGAKSDATHIQSLYSFGIWITLSGVISPLMVYGDRFFVSAAVGASLLPLYAIPQEGLQRLLIIPGSLCSALLPKMAGLPAQQKNDLYRISYRHVALIMFGVCLASALLAYPVLSIWLNPAFAKQSLLIVMILAFGIWLNSMAQVPFTFLHANADTKLTAIFHIIELVIYLFALYYLVYLFGLVGAALAWTLRVGIDLMLLQWAVKKSDLIERVN